MVDTKAVSVRLPLDLLNELNSYATDKGMVRGGDANIGGAIIAVLRQHFGEPDNVKQVSDNVDIESIVNDAVESRLEAVLNQVRDLELKVHSQETYSLLYTSLKADVDIRFDETNKAIADIKEATAPDAIPEPEDDSNPESTGNSLEPDTLPIIEVIANIAAPTVEDPLPANALSDAIAASAKPTKKQSKSKKALSEIDVEQAYEIAKSRGYGGSIQSFKQDFSRQKEAFGQKYGLERWKKEEGHTKPYSYRDTL